MNNSRLKLIQNWPELARQAKWSAVALAEKCGVSVRTLDRYILNQKGQNTKNWLADQRQRQGNKLLREGSSIKEAAFHLGYKHPGNFARKYKEHWGIYPSQELVTANHGQM